MKPVALFTHSDCLAHDTGPHHPERPDRLRAVLQALEHPDFVPLLREQAPEASREQLCLAHPAEHVDRLLALHPEPGELLAIDPDTVVSAGTMAAARRGAGGAVAAVDAVMEGWASAAFVAVRPPGHHAERVAGDGVLLLQQRRHRRPPCPRPLGAGPGRRGGFRRASRQRHGGYF